MGQDIHDSPYPPDESLNPGTYRIFNPTAGTSIQMSYHDPTGVVTWENHGGENQQVCDPKWIGTSTVLKESSGF
jgi:hypothetical protein